MRFTGVYKAFNIVLEIVNSLESLFLLPIHSKLGKIGPNNVTFIVVTVFINFNKKLYLNFGIQLILAFKVFEYNSVLINNLKLLCFCQYYVIRESYYCYLYPWNFKSW